MAISKIPGAGVSADTLEAGDIADDAIGTAELANDVVISTSGAITTTGAFTSVGIDDNADATAITIDSSERVGIGTTTPAAQLDIQGPAGTGTASAGVLRLSTAETTVVDNDQIGRIEFITPLEASGTDSILLGASINAEANQTFGASVNSTDLVFATGDSEAATEKMRLTSAGKVGIGTGSPETLLHLESSLTIEPTIKVVDTNGDGAGPQLYFKKHGGSAADNDEIGRLRFDAQNDANQTLQWFNIIAYLQDASDGAEKSKLYFVGRSGGAEAIPLKLEGNQTITSNLKLTKEGTLGSGTSTDAAVIWHDMLFMHDGGAEYRFEETSTGDVIMKFNRNGSVFAYSFSSSDELLKKDIVDIPYGLTEVLSMKPRSFTFKKNGIQSMGFIAQEIETLFPEIVAGEDAEIKEENKIIEYDDGTTETRTTYTDGKALDYNAFSAILCKAIQELSTKNDALEAENTALKTRMDALEARVTALE